LKLRRYMPEGYNYSESQRKWLQALNIGRDVHSLLVNFSAQPKPFWSQLPVSPCLTDWGEIMHPTYPTKCAYVEPKSGQV
jgi:hypothetical protein